MGQAPLNLGSQELSFGLIGSGRVARHFARYFEFLQIPATLWSRSSSHSAELALRDVDYVWLAISDDALEPFLLKNSSWLKSKKAVFHFSGAQTLQGAIAVHPLMTFGKVAEHDLEFYRTIPFVTDPEADKHTEVWTRLLNPRFSIPPTQRALYHALCVMMGNLPMLLWGEGAEIARSQLGLSFNEIFAPYLQQCLSNALANPESSLTGPWVRGDQKTIQKNLAALEATSLFALYQEGLKLYENRKRS